MNKAGIVDQPRPTALFKLALSFLFHGPPLSFRIFCTGCKCGLGAYLSVESFFPSHFFTLFSPLQWVNNRPNWPCVVLPWSFYEVLLEKNVIKRAHKSCGKKHQRSMTNQLHVFRFGRIHRIPLNAAMTMLLSTTLLSSTPKECTFYQVIESQKSMQC